MQLTAQVVDMMGLKRLAMSRIKPTSQLRGLILAEPDTLPVDEARAKVQIFHKLLAMELAN